MSKRTRRTDHNIPLADYLRKHSPLKPSASLAGLEVDHHSVKSKKVTKITDRIYLGNFLAAKDKDFFKDKKIKAVLNCTKDSDVPNHFAHIRDIEYMRIPVDDSLREKDFELMYKYMPCIAEFIHKHVDIAKNNILIHCVAGQQRSAISVAAYLVAKRNMTPQQACKFIMDKRHQAFWFGTSLNFDKSLLKYYHDLKKKKC